jgi:hypothetical protein
MGQFGVLLSVVDFLVQPLPLGFHNLSNLGV